MPRKLSPQEAREMAQKSLRSPNRTKRGKGKKTVLREEAYKEMIKEIVDVSGDLIREQIKIGKMKAGESASKMLVKNAAIDSVLNRGFGKAVESVDLTSKGDKIMILPPAIIKKHNLSKDDN